MKHPAVRSTSIFTLSLCVLLLSSSASFASLLSQGINFGAAGPHQPGRNWAVFSLGGFEDDNELSGTVDVFGDVGIADGDLKMSGSAMISGIAYLKTGRHFSRSGNAAVTGGVVQNGASDSLLSQGVIDSVAASNAAFAMGTSVGYPTAINANTSLTLNTTGDAVLKLTDFKLSSSAILTLSGTAASSFVINVSNKFEMSGASRIRLTGGLTWDNVVFNVRGGGDVKISGGSELTGIILATGRKVELSGSSKVHGEIIADKVQLSGSSQVNRPPVVSP